MKNPILLFLFSFLICSCGQPEAHQPKLNEIQVIGSHNSYKLKMDPLIWQGVYTEDSIQAMELDYGHPSLTTQLELGLRSLELDVYHDPSGGKFKHPFGLKMIEMAGELASPFDSLPMEDPGMKVLHNHDFDFRSSCATLKICLNEIKSWSAANPGHWPVIITMNTKEEFIDRPGFQKPFSFSKAALDSLDREILEVFDRSQLIVPDDIRGDLSSLEEAVLTKGWGQLNNALGKFLFVLDQQDDILERYIDGHPGLKDRVLFANAPKGTPEAAFLILNDPVENFELIRECVKAGYLVRTRADAGTWEARRNDTLRFEKAKASGAQIISTDYFIPDESFGNGYQIKFPNGKYQRLNLPSE